MLLRASSRAAGKDAELESAIGELAGGDGGVEHGELLVAFAEALVRAQDDLDEIRSQLLAALGPERFVEAAATVGAFNGLVRVADSTGIPIDGETLERSAELRDRLGFNRWRGAVASGAAESGAGGDLSAFPDRGPDTAEPG